MKSLACTLLASILAGTAFGQLPRPITRETAEIPSGALRLKGFIWTPEGIGPFPAVLFNHGRSDEPQQHTGSLTITEAANILGPVFAKHGYVCLYLFRRGEGLSADQGPFIGDVLRRAELTSGAEARIHLQFVLLSTDHLHDGQAGLQFLKGLRTVDARRIAVAGHSFGGQITLLEAASDPTLRAVVTFGAAANSWNRSAEIRAGMLSTIAGISVPVLLIHAANDYSVAPGQALAGERVRLSKPVILKIYPPVGKTANDGHNFLYTNVGLWEEDVFQFLDEHVKR